MVGSLPAILFWKTLHLHIVQGGTWTFSARSRPEHATAFPPVTFNSGKATLVTDHTLGPAESGPANLSSAPEAAFRVCLVAPGNLASNPRLVKEAAALHKACFRVRVVAGNTMTSFRDLDSSLLACAPWPCVQVNLQTGIGWFFSAAFRRFCR